MEREQAAMEQAEMEQAEMEQRRTEPSGWVHADYPLAGSFTPDTFANLGNHLNSQVMQLTADGSSQTPATATATATAASTTAATTTDAQADTTTPLASPVPPPSPPGGSPPSRRIILGLLAVVVMLLGTNAYSHNQGRALKVENSSLQARVAQLENASFSGTGSSQGSMNGCGGNQLIDTCWLKMGWGACAENAVEDTVKPLEDALRVAWDSTAEVFGIVTDTVRSDMRQVCDALHSFGSFMFEL